MFRCPQFTCGDFKKRKVFLEDEVYGLALDALTKACSDVLVVSPDGENILLGKRKVYPQPDWWLIGGRSRPGQSPQEGASANVKRELRIDAEPSRYHVVGSYNLVWEMRQQKPNSNGTADISTVHALTLTEQEFKSCDLNLFEKKEYSEVKWTKIEDILNGNYNPSLRQFVHDLCSMRKYHHLCGLVKNSADDKTVAKAARDLIKWHESAADSKGAHVVFNEKTREYLEYKPA
ncbi:hypothetical protein AAMO2058_000244800 [Amorphochlora amoebiformis]